MLKKDLIELCLLHLLDVEDLYGYEILHRIHKSFPDTQESAIYALLRGLCKDGCTKQYEGKVSENTIILPRLDNQSERNYSMNGVDSVILS